MSAVCGIAGCWIWANHSQEKFFLFQAMTRSHRAKNFQEVLMIDTLGIVTTAPPDFDTTRLEGRATTYAPSYDTGEIRERTRYFNIAPRGGHEPLVTYTPTSRAGRRLRVELSLPNWLGLPMAVLSQADVDHALDKLDEWISARGLAVRPVREWKVSRIDFCYCWATDRDTPIYIAAFAEMQLGKYRRVPFGASGVVWKAGTSGYRWVKFYNKAEEQGHGGAGVLRFEVSNYRQSIAQVAGRIPAYQTKLDQSLHESIGRGWVEPETLKAIKQRIARKLLRPFMQVKRMTRRDVSAREVLYWLNQLGVGGGMVGEKEELERRLVAAFGTRGAPGAAFFLSNFDRYGIAMYKPPLSLMTQPTFYRWKKRLSDEGLLARTDKPGGVPPLILPDLKSYGKDRLTYG